MTADVVIDIGIKGDIAQGRTIKRNLDDIAKSGDKTTKSVDNASKSFDKLHKAIIAIGGATAALIFFNRAISMANEFSKSVAELSTLLDDTTGSMNALSMAAKQQAVIFGSQPVEQSRALYQIISAGASSASEAIETLNASNKLAVGGVTNVAIAADGLTSVLNAYGDKVRGATDVSDSLFVAMRAGKTTIEELASGLGKVAPLAATLNVQFDELTASVAALTKGGISTQESITGVRAILAAVAKPTKEASDAAKELGINFSAAGIQTLGFQGFIEDLVEKTGGSTETLAQLFGGVEALVPILALSGEAGRSFNQILEDMGQKAGATEVAFNKIADSPAFKIDRLISAISTKMLEWGETMQKVVAPAAGFLADNINLLQDSIVSLTAGAVTLFAVMNAGAFKSVVLSVTSMTSAFLASQAAMVSMVGVLGTMQIALSGLVAILTGPIGIAVGLAAVVSGLTLFMSRSKDASEVYNDFKNTLSDTRDEIDLTRIAFEKLTSAQRQEALLKLKIALQEGKDAVKQLQEEVNNGEIGGFFDQFSRYGTRLQSELFSLRNEYRTGNIDLTEYKESLGLLAEKFPEFGKNALESIDEINKLENALSDVADIQSKINDINFIGPIAPPKTVNKNSNDNTPISQVSYAIDSHKDLLEAIKASRSEEEKLIDKMLKLESLRPYAASAEEINGINRAIKSAQDELEEFRLQAELDSPLANTFKNISSEIEDGLKDAFKNAFTATEGGWSKLLEGFKSTFDNLLAELAYQALAKPVIVSAVAGVGASMGLSNPAIALTLGVNGTASGSGVDLLGLGSTLGGQATSGFFSSALTGVNNFGSQLGLGFASPVGANLPGAVSLTSSLGLGGLGGLGASMLGLGSGNVLIDSGLSLAGGFAGGALGSSIGTVLGLAGGPIGAVLGGFAGTALGGLFGGKPSDKSQKTYIDLADLTRKTSGQSGDKFSQENRDFADSSIDAVEQLALALKGAGATLEGSVSAMVGSRDGLRVSGVNYGYNNSAYQQALIDRVFNSVTDGSDTLLNSIGKVDRSSFESAIEDIQIIQLIDAFETAEESLPALTVALNELESQFDNLKDKATDLGLPVDSLTEAYEKQKDAIIDSALAPLQDFLDSQSLSANSSLSLTDKLSNARSIFDENLLAIQGGDFTNLDAITSQANQVLDLGRDIFASGSGFTSLEAYVRESIANIADTLGAPNSLDSGLNREIVLSNEKQNSLLAQMNAQIESLVAENAKLRKSMERVGNQLVAYNG